MKNKPVEVLAGEAITDKPLKEIEVPVWRYTWIDKLMRRPKSRTFVIYRCRVVNMKRSSTVAYKIGDIPKEIKSMEDMTRIVYPLIHNHIDDVVYLIACCIQNDSREPEKWLMKYISDNMSSEMMFDVLITCIASTGMQSFFSAMLLLKGVSVNIVKATVADRADVQG